ncbi:hypothetical protein LLG96_06210 [bacterium]|nr:hypothetical protein [bacterium]
MKKVFMLLLIALLTAMGNSPGYAQGYKNILDRLKTIEDNLDRLGTKQDKDTQVFQQQLAEMKSVQNPSGQDASNGILQSEVRNMKTDMERISSEVARIARDIDQVKKNDDPQISQDVIRELDTVIARLQEKIEATPAPQSNKSGARTAEPEKTDETPKLAFEPYGYFMFDMSYDQARAESGNYVFWVNDTPPPKKKDNELNMTARQSRIGWNVSYKGLKEHPVTARFEFDFYGGGAENKNIPLIRHGYLKADFGSYYVLAGQTSDVISPLVPTTVNYTVLWNCGNIGYRHPQIQIGSTFKNGIEVVGALSRNIAGDVDNDGKDDGEDSVIPTVQARFSYITPTINTGVSGHYGVMDYTNQQGKDKQYTSYSVNFHASYAINKSLLIKGEAFTGKTLSQYLAGIGQGFDYKLDREVESTGGWFSATLKTGANTRFNAGMGIDQPKKDENLAFPARNSNRCVFGNVYTPIAYKTSLAFEVSHWTTGYYRGANQTKDISSVRFQTALIFTF